jgi:GTP pyrophosphokinase
MAMNSGTSHLKLVEAPLDAQAAAWLAGIAGHFAPADREALRAVLAFVAAAYGDRRLASGEPALSHALETAALVGALRLDHEALAAALAFHCSGVAPGAAAQLRAQFGAAIADLAEGVLRMAQIGALSSRPQAMLRPDERASQLEALRKMLLSMVQDMRVVLIKLADHTQDLRYLAGLEDSELRRDTARLSRDIFAPLANRLGVWQLKSEMEDLAFQILEPATWQRIDRLLDETRADRARYIENVIALLKGSLARAGIAAEVTGRPKHIFSIYEKMSKKAYDLTDVYDVRAVRVLLASVTDCYGALGLVHSLWSPIPREFDDYIARPKRNEYRSLHTAVIGPEGKALEVQIRTHEMHQHAELGVAAHWRYKEGSRRERGYDDRIAWLRRILEWKDQIGDEADLAEQFKSGLFEDTIYVLTPQGKVIDLPKGSTPVDFAYHVHTELGHRCRGAKVDGAMVPLNTPLANGQRVEILAAKQGGPSRDWLNPALGYVRSHGARAKIRQWYNRQQFDEAVAQGRTVVEKELQRHGMTRLNLDKLASQLEFEEADDFLAALGRGEIGQRHLQNAILALDPRAEKVAADKEFQAPSRKPQRVQGRGSVLIVGVDELLTAPAKCCKPAPPDAIIGFITRGRGVTIHRVACVNVKRLAGERVVAAEWGESAGATYPVEIEVRAKDRSGLRREIAEALSREKIRIAATDSAASDGIVRLRYTVEVSDLGHLQRALALLRDLRGVTRAVRR